MNERQLAIRREELKELAKEVRELHAEHEEAKALAFQQQDAAVWKAFQAGKRLFAIKKKVGHGNWLPFLRTNLPMISEGTAQLYMKLARLNPKARRVGDLVCESIRKYRYSYMPPKGGPKVLPEHRIARLVHAIAVVNDFNRWRRRRQIGLIPSNPTEEKREFREMFEWLRAEYFTDEF